MVESKEFLGKTLDAAIQEACTYFGVAREKLEVDIIEDAKTGIFGIVGARKAKIKARLAMLPDFITSASGSGEAPRKKSRKQAEKPSLKEEARKKQKQDEAEGEAPQAAEAPQEAALESALPESLGAAPAPDAAEDSKSAASTSVEDAPEAEVPSASSAPRSIPEKEHRTRRERTGKKAAPRQEEEAAKSDDDAFESAFPKIPLLELDQEKLFGETRTILGALAAPVLGLEPEQLELSMEISDDRLLASIHNDDTGLLIGRDGQNLAAIQYISSRILSKNMGSIIRLQVDAGDYHFRQDARLQELALALAEKVRATGKPQTTRPLSAYQRRVIHMALQNIPDVQTRSSGEGPLKHVVIIKSKD